MEKFQKFEKCQIENLEKVQGGRQKTGGGCFTVEGVDGEIITYSYEKDVIRNNGVLIRKRIRRI